MYLLQLAFFNCIKMYCANDLGFFQGEKITPMLLFFSSRVSAATESLVTNIIIQTINANAYRPGSKLLCKEFVSLTFLQSLFK